MIEVTFWYFVAGCCCGVGLWEAARWLVRHDGGDHD